MTPIQHFDSVWQRCDELVAMHTFLAANLTTVLPPDELLRAEWATRVSALDLYVHELVAQKMFDLFAGRKKPPSKFLRFQISYETMARIRSAKSKADRCAAFDLEVRSRLALLTFQDPEKIADGVRYISDVELWNSVALYNGATAATASTDAKNLKRALSLIVERRNKIVHEGDLQPTVPRVPWPINRADLQHVATVVENIARAIDKVV